jgi:ribosome-associated toxin RatA of RatAB toxin-antitoxin module
MHTRLMSEMLSAEVSVATRSTLWALCLALGMSSTALAADPAKPHEHTGQLKPYSKNPPAIVISPAEQAQLDAKKPVMRQGDNRGMAVFVVDAPPDITWKTINTFASYPKYIPEVKKCEVYKKGDGFVDVDFELKSYMVTIEYYVHHTVNHAKKTMTWTLDYSRESDINDSVGFWRINEVVGQPNQSLVEYSIDVSLSSWTPGFVKTMMVDEGLTTATTWLKREAEKKWQKVQKETPPPAPAPAAPVDAPAPAAPAP